MRLTRREFLRIAPAVWLPGAVAAAPAKAYPSRPVRWVVPFAPGGGTDIVARALGQWLSARLGQPFVIDNRPGGAANIGTGVVARAAPDGYTLLLVASVNAINASLYHDVGFDFIHDIAPVAGIMRVPNVVVTNPSLPAASIPELVTYARANPGKVNFGSAGNGTTQHLAGELFKIMAGVDMVHVPYRGTAPALLDLIRGQVQLAFLNAASCAEYAKAGKLRELAVTSAARLPALPDLPTVAEFLPGYEVSLFYGVGAPRETPSEVIDKLNRDINAGLAEPGIRAQLAALDGAVIAGTASDFGRLVVDEAHKWSKVVKLANIRPD